VTAEDLPVLRTPLRVAEVPQQEGHPPAGVPHQDQLHPEAALPEVLPREVHHQEVHLPEAHHREVHPAEDRPLRSAATAAPAQEALLQGEERKEESVLLPAHIYSLR
jgi:hypothetical protein